MVERNSDNFPTIVFDDCSFAGSQYKRGNKKWKATTLQEYVDKLKLVPFKFPLACIDLTDEQSWMKDADLSEICFQFKRVMKTDLKYPIILDNTGQIADGYHRIIKALCQGKKYVMAYRLPDMPECDFEEKDNEE